MTTKIAAPDRTVKVLLALLVLGVWGVLLRPLLSFAAPARAQESSVQGTAPAAVSGGVVATTTSTGKDYEFVVVATPRKAYFFRINGYNYSLAGTEKLD